MSFLGKGFIILGIILIILGVFLAYGSKILPLGRLPGDIKIERKNFVFYFPITTCLLLSLILTLILTIIFYIRK
ncbi:MAG: DUF2905 domain-containing protein [Dictyoglomaceae bacterium]|nr:DUF2905 domain-containing protein [Dictyoglomaceae bacterium]